MATDSHFFDVLCTIDMLFPTMINDLCDDVSGDTYEVATLTSKRRKPSDQKITGVKLNCVSGICHKAYRPRRRRTNLSWLCDSWIHSFLGSA